MLKIFISYSRESAPFAESLARDIEDLGHEPWLDRALTGGQPWWEQILANIRGCDAIALVVDPRSIDSTACQREYAYARALHRPIVPVLASDVPAQRLPPALAEIQFIDYRSKDRTAVVSLARALGRLASGVPLPDPLPKPPDVPISYLNSLAERVDADSLTFEQQSALVLELKDGLRSPGDAPAARELLERLLSRRDLFARLSDEIEAALTTDERRTPSGIESLPGGGVRESNEATSTSARARTVAALSGFLGAGAIGVTAALSGPSSSHASAMSLAIIAGGGCAIAGAIVGLDKKSVFLTALGATLVSVSFLVTASHNTRSPGWQVTCVLAGMPLGAIAGAMVSLFLRGTLSVFRRSGAARGANTRVAP